MDIISSILCNAFQLPSILFKFPSFGCFKDRYCNSREGFLRQTDHPSKMATGNLTIGFKWIFGGGNPLPTVSFRAPVPLKGQP